MSLGCKKNYFFNKHMFFNKIVVFLHSELVIKR